MNIQKENQKSVELSIQVAVAFFGGQWTAGSP